MTSTTYEQQRFNGGSISESGVGHQTFKRSRAFIRTIPGRLRYNSAITASGCFSGITTLVRLSRHPSSTVRTWVVYTSNLDAFDDSRRVVDICGAS